MCCRTSDNRAYLASALRTSAQILLRRTSDTLNPLIEIMGPTQAKSGVSKSGVRSPHLTYLVYLVYLVDLVYLVYLVCLAHMREA